MKKLLLLFTVAVGIQIVIANCADSVVVTQKYERNRGNYNAYEALGYKDQKNILHYCQNGQEVQNPVWKKGETSQQSCLDLITKKCGKLGDENGSCTCVGNSCLWEPIIEANPCSTPVVVAYWYIHPSLSSPNHFKYEVYGYKFEKEVHFCDPNNPNKPREVASHENAFDPGKEIPISEEEYKTNCGQQTSCFVDA